jgi:hypothetical protein
MKNSLKKIVFNDKNKVDSIGVLAKRIENIHGIWNNTHHDDVGVEKVLRLFLAISQFFFPGIYIKQLFWKKGYNAQDVAMDIYIIFKVVFPLTLLYSNWISASIAQILVIYLLIETLLYVPTLIFASDLFARPNSYRRSILMLFFNYLEISFTYAFFYACGNYLNHPLNNWYDSIYFSMTTLSTIGYGELYPTTGIGKLLVCSQSLIFLTFVVLFINFFTNNVENHGYFNHKKSSD